MHPRSSIVRPRWRLALALALPLFAASGAAQAQDQDGDGAADAVDVFPCDGSLTGQAFAPAEGVFGQVSFEDEWPNASDTDFNDLVVGYNYELRSNSAGVLEADLQFEVIAAGGVLDSGLGLVLPVPLSSLASATRTVGGGSPTNLIPSTADTSVTLIVSSNVREFFGGAAGPVNARSDLARVGSTTVVVHLVFASPVTLDTANAPFDLFTHRTGSRGHEIHLPLYGGTSQMNQNLFGSGNDGSTPSRKFVDTTGLPYALAYPDLVIYPQEQVTISGLYPDVLQFAASGGTTHQDFYLTNVNASAGYLSAGNLGPLTPTPAMGVAPDSSCVPSVLSGQIFATSGVFTPPSGVTTVRVLVIGGGGGGGGGHQGGGGSGFVESGTFDVSGPITITVGSGGAGALGTSSNGNPSGINGTASSFGSLLSAAGGETTPGVNTRGGHGGSGGGGSGNSGAGAAGGSNGSGGSAATYSGGTGQGAFDAHFSGLTLRAFSAGTGGNGGTSSHGGGGGGGGIFIDGAGPSGASGLDANSAGGGGGYGGGGGGGGCCQSSPSRAGGGAGAPGAVYIEYGSSTPTPTPTPTPTSGNSQFFAGAGTFTPPSGTTTVRVLVVGGGGGGGGGHQGGGGSGYVQSGTFDITGPIAITVGGGGIGAAGSSSNGFPSGVNGTSSSFGSLLSAGGGETTPGTNTRGGHGGSGGGGSGNSGSGAAGGANGSNGSAATYVGGNGQGAFDSHLAGFTDHTFTSGQGGSGGSSSHGGGGGGGGIIVDGGGISGAGGLDANSAGGGQGYGGGGGGGGCCQSTPSRAGGGDGAVGFVYVEVVSNTGGSTGGGSTGGGSGSSNSGSNHQLFDADGTFTPPSGVTTFTVMAIGGGGGGGGGHQGGGGSGYVSFGTFTVTGPVAVTVGTGGTGAMGSSANDQPSGTNGMASNFGSLLSAAGGQTTPGVNTRGGHGGSGGGGSGNSGSGAAGGTNGGNGSAATYSGGTGQGAFDGQLAGFLAVTLTAGQGGSGGSSSHGGGGGGGGVVVAGSSVSGAGGLDANSAGGGEGYGGGGGGGGCCQSTPSRAGGGDGANGMVYIEW